MTIKPTSDAVAVTQADRDAVERLMRQFHMTGTMQNNIAGEIARARREGHRLASTRPMTEGESGERCHDCGGFYATVYRVPDDVWAKIAPDKAALGEHEEHRYGGLLCLPCADRRAREKGIRLYFDASVGDWRPSDAALLADICDNMAEVLKPLPGELPNALGDAGTRATESGDGDEA
jgi:hypothetical protein